MPQGQILQIEAIPILYLLSKYLVFGKLLPEPGSYGSLPPLLYWIRYSLPVNPCIRWYRCDAYPVAWAGWAVYWVTALNLIPAGQLDGGHILYVLLGRRATTCCR